MTQEPAATKARNFRSFLLMAQFEAEEIGARIKRARELAGLTQEELAALASFSKRSLQDYETGVTVPYKHLRELGMLLGKPVEWFLGQADSPDVREELAALRDKVDELLRRSEPAPPEAETG